MAQRSETIVGFSMRTLALIIGVALATGCGQSHRVCAVCNRDECKGLAFRVTLENGKNVETCCPRCALHYLETNHQQARQMEATDFATGSWVDASRAIYVSESDVHPCATLETRRDPQGCCMLKTYDRCLPSLVAFQQQEAAKAFAKEHGGQVIAWKQVTGKSE
jgi:hypothetical protein